jgi:hypothetical protein
MCQLLRAKPLYLAREILKAGRIEGGLAQHIFKADIVESQQLPDYIKDAVAELSPDLF